MSIKWMTHVKNGGILELGIGIWKERLRTAKWHQKFYEQKLLLENHETIEILIWNNSVM